MSKILCIILGHKWGWYLPNHKDTVIGTQYCSRCHALRGVKVKLEGE